MVFANLSTYEKDAFFTLLDEYFSSRPDLLGSAGSGDGVNAEVGRAAAASALQHAFSRTSPQEAASTINTLRKSIPHPPANHADASSSMGRVASAAAAFNSSGAPVPRPPPRRGASSAVSEERDASPPEHSRLIPQKKFGDVDISSGKAMFSSLRNSAANKTAAPPQVAPPTPAAFPSRKNNFAPPPVRRADSTISTPSPPPPPPPPPVRARQEEEVEGEWAEALYDYTSEDPGDLELQAGQQVVVVERTSDDWWTGEINGRRGLMPAAYVKVL